MIFPLPATLFFGFIAVAFPAFATGIQVETRPSVSRPAETDDPFEDIVVTGRRGVIRPALEPVQYFRRYCFEANRLTRASAAPIDDPEWEPVGGDLRRRLKMADAQSVAYSLTDPARRHTLILKLERFPLPWRLTESRCTLIILGGEDHFMLVRRVSAMLGGPLTQRHVGHSDGQARVPGWRQWLWTGMPGHRSKNWRAFRRDGPGAAGGTWLVVFDSQFYDSYDYIFADLKIKEGGNRQVTVLTFSHRYRNRPGS